MWLRAAFYPTAKQIYRRDTNKALDEFGIGRPSTYAPTISTIIARGYVVRDKKMLVPTELGIIVTNIMKESFSDIVDIKFTADMEDELDKIEGEKGMD